MSLKHKKVLVTYGPTWVAIDRVRVISNISTGETGQRIIEHLKKRGATVTALEGPVTRSLSVRAHNTFNFLYFHELRELLKKHLKKRYDAVIHAAAVSDFRIKNPSHAKMPSDKTGHAITLIPAEKLIKRIKKLAASSFLVGFKLEPSKDPRTLKRKAEKLFSEAPCDLVVANTVDTDYRACIFNKNMDILAQTRNRCDTARLLVNILDQSL